MPASSGSTAGKVLRVGLISDTHGLLRPEALQALRGSDFLIHGGDIGDPAILEQLARIAPLTVVRGNNDDNAAYDALPHSAVLEVGGVRILVIHDVKELGKEALRGADVVVSGHSHKPSSLRRDGVLYVNPGSAGPRRFKLPIAVGCLLLRGGEVRAELIELPPAKNSPVPR